MVICPSQCLNHYYVKNAEQIPFSLLHIYKSVFIFACDNVVCFSQNPPNRSCWCEVPITPLHSHYNDAVVMFICPGE